MKILLVITFIAGAVSAVVAVETTSSAAQAGLVSSLIDPSLMDSLLGSDSTTAIFVMKSSTPSVLENLSQIEYASREEKIGAVTSALQNNAITSHANIMNYFNSLVPILLCPGAVATSYWIDDTVAVKNACMSLITDMVQKMSVDISLVKKEMLLPLVKPIKVTNPPPANGTNVPQWGVAQINARNVSCNGTGVLVATIDTGARLTHEALKSNYGGYWLDSFGKHNTPYDDVGHGTHTMGTIVGTSNGIGVAPGAQWVACKGCSSRDCPETSLKACGQFVLCLNKTNGICTKAAHVVSNSWGGGQGDKFYNDIISAWRAADIIPVFAIGNAGSTCGTANSPGDQDIAIGVGSTDLNDTMSYFSSRGPSVNATNTNTTKPDVAAPGSNIVSSYYTSDTAYIALSGTSMATPHVAGTFALLICKNLNLKFNQIMAAFAKGCAPVKPTGDNCGGKNDSLYPNNNNGFGRIDAYLMSQELNTTP